MIIRFFTTIIVSLCALAAQAATDVNKASRAELEALHGVGPSLSGKIIDARKTGEFRNWDDLVDRVSGIGPGSASKLSQAGLTVAGAGYGAGAAPTAGTSANTPASPKARKADAPGKAEGTSSTSKPIAIGSKSTATELAPSAKAGTGIGR